LEQAVIVFLPLSDDEFGSPEENEALHALEVELAEAVEKASAGAFDGNEFGGGQCVFFMYGPDADRLFGAIEPLLKTNAAAAGGCAIKRYGEVLDPDAKQVRVTW